MSSSKAQSPALDEATWGEAENLMIFIAKIQKLRYKSNFVKVEFLQEFLCYQGESIMAYGKK